MQLIEVAAPPKKIPKTTHYESKPLSADAIRKAKFQASLMPDKPSDLPTSTTAPSAPVATAPSSPPTSAPNITQPSSVPSPTTSSSPGSPPRVSSPATPDDSFASTSLDVSLNNLLVAFF